MKYFKAIEYPYVKKKKKKKKKKKFFNIISKYCPISNSNLDAVIHKYELNRIKYRILIVVVNELYNINYNSNRNNIVNNRRISDSKR